ncbi:hypothetical protein B0H14DRAFT_2581133 [Mycena olivaceomarginata]|nr:hypothetical protein B0H14DRAFT_2581133 [Mycena olivaceomarginata]
MTRHNANRQEKGYSRGHPNTDSKKHIHTSKITPNQGLELERQVFELAAHLHPSSIPALLRVAHRILLCDLLPPWLDAWGSGNSCFLYVIFVRDVSGWDLRPQQRAPGVVRV